MRLPTRLREIKSRFRLVNAVKNFTDMGISRQPRPSITMAK